MKKSRYSEEQIARMLGEVNAGKSVRDRERRRMPPARYQCPEHALFGGRCVGLERLRALGLGKFDELFFDYKN